MQPTTIDPTFGFCTRYRFCCVECEVYQTLLNITSTKLFDLESDVCPDPLSYMLPQVTCYLNMLFEHSLGYIMKSIRHLVVYKLKLKI